MFIGLKVRHSQTGAVGVIQSAFGTAGKFRVIFADGINAAPAATSTSSSTTSSDESTNSGGGGAKLLLDYKKMVFRSRDGETAKRKLIQ